MSAGDLVELKVEGKIAKIKSEKGKLKVQVTFKTDEVSAKDEITEGTRVRIENENEFLVELDILYSYGSTATIQANNRECLIWLVQTNENYRKWNKLSLRQGGFLQNNSYNNKQIVIDNKVAFSLFGNTEGQDINVEVAGDTYVVKGVTKQTIYDEYKCKKQNVVGNAYYMRVENDILLNGFIICNLSDERLKNQEMADLLLITLGRNKEDYIYISASEYAQRLSHSMKFIRLSMMMMLLIILWKELIASIRLICRSSQIGVLFCGIVALFF